MSEKPKRSVSATRIRMTEIAGVIVSLLFVFFLGGKYLVGPYLKPDAAATRNAITYETIEPYAIEGDILDRGGSLIMGGGEPGIGISADYPENYSFAWLLGYYSVSADGENRFGIRGNTSPYTTFMLDKNNRGATTRLTIDSSLQNYAWESLLAGQEGSVTVIDNKSGAILCLASQSTIDYDVNDVSTLLYSDVPDSQFRRGTFENDPPGSTFKIVTAAAALQKAEEEGLGEDFFYYYDDGSYTPEGDDFTITNYGYYSYGDLDLETAMNSSVNCYFANLGIKIGQTALHNMAENFLVGQDIDIPFLGPIHSQFSYGDGSPAYLAQAAFGQGNTEITPLHLALIAQAIANRGEMMQPYIVESIRLDKLPLYTHIRHKLNNCITDSVDEKLKAIMHSTAEGYGLDEATYGYVCAKTGTAECADGRIHTYLVGFTEDASFCISMNNADDSSVLYGVAQLLVDYLNTIYA
ncbi:MAG: hypothetical protein IJH14_11355 [Solobacterium sp.]|nr:hypothetical protein [Solobacterium sp.]